MQLVQSPIPEEFEDVYRRTKDDLSELAKEFNLRAEPYLAILAMIESYRPPPIILLDSLTETI